MRLFSIISGNFLKAKILRRYETCSKEARASRYHRALRLARPLNSGFKVARGIDLFSACTLMENLIFDNPFQVRERIGHMG